MSCALSVQACARTPEPYPPPERTPGRRTRSRPDVAPGRRI